MKKEPAKNCFELPPDMEICRAEEMGMEQFAKCLVENPIICQYALTFGYGIFCRHPNRKAIIQNTTNSVNIS
jgi:hypothetical protein